MYIIMNFVLNMYLRPYLHSENLYVHTYDTYIILWLILYLHNIYVCTFGKCILIMVQYIQYVHIFDNVYIRTYMWTYVHEYMYTYVHAWVHVRICTYLRVHMYIMYLHLVEFCYVSSRVLT